MHRMKTETRTSTPSTFNKSAAVTPSGTLILAPLNAAALNSFRTLYLMPELLILPRTLVSSCEIGETNNNRREFQPKILLTEQRRREKRGRTGRTRAGVKPRFARVETEPI